MSVWILEPFDLSDNVGKILISTETSDQVSKISFFINDQRFTVKQRESSGYRLPEKRGMTTTSIHSSPTCPASIKLFIISQNASIEVVATEQAQENLDKIHRYH